MSKSFFLISTELFIALIVCSLSVVTIDVIPQLLGFDASTLIFFLTRAILVALMLVYINSCKGIGTGRLLAASGVIGIALSVFICNAIWFPIFITNYQPFPGQTVISNGVFIIAAIFAVILASTRVIQETDSDYH